MPLGSYGFGLGAAIRNLGEEAMQELGRAIAKFEPMHSPHEGLAVIEEELAELREHVYGDTGRGDAARAEAIQLAAMSLRYVLDLCDSEAERVPAFQRLKESGPDMAQRSA